MLGSKKPESCSKRRLIFHVAHTTMLKLTICLEIPSSLADIFHLHYFHSILHYRVQSAIGQINAVLWKCHLRQARFHSYPLNVTKASGFRMYLCLMFYAPHLHFIFLLLLLSFTYLLHLCRSKKSIYLVLKIE